MGAAAAVVVADLCVVAAAACLAADLAGAADLVRTGELPVVPMNRIAPTATASSAAHAIGSGRRKARLRVDGVFERADRARDARAAAAADWDGRGLGDGDSAGLGRVAAARRVRPVAGARRVGRVAVAAGAVAGAVAAGAVAGAASNSRSSSSASQPLTTSSAGKSVPSRPGSATRVAVPAESGSHRSGSGGAGRGLLPRSITH